MSVSGEVKDKTWSGICQTTDRLRAIRRPRTRPGSGSLIPPSRDYPSRGKSLHGRRANQSGKGREGESRRMGCGVGKYASGRCVRVRCRGSVELANPTTHILCVYPTSAMYGTLFTRKPPTGTVCPLSVVKGEIVSLLD